MSEPNNKDFIVAFGAIFGITFLGTGAFLGIMTGSMQDSVRDFILRATFGSRLPKTCDYIQYTDSKGRYEEYVAEVDNIDALYNTIEQKPATYVRQHLGAISPVVLSFGKKGFGGDLSHSFLHLVARFLGLRTGNLDKPGLISYITTTSSITPTRDSKMQSKTLKDVLLSSHPQVMYSFRNHIHLHVCHPAS